MKGHAIYGLDGKIVTLTEEEYASLPHKTGRNNRPSDNAVRIALWIKSQGGKCLRCGSTDNLTQDHVVPKIYGGRKYLENRQLLCVRCNYLKDARRTDYRTPEVMRAIYRTLLLRKIHWWAGLQRRRQQMAVQV